MLNILSRLNLNYVIIFFIIIALILGVVIYQRDFAGVNLVNDNSDNEQQLVSRSAPQNGLPVSLLHSNPDLLSDDEKKLLDYPGESDSDEERNEYMSLLMSLAVRTDEIDISNCQKPSPFVAEVQMSRPLTLNNSDSNARKLVFLGQDYEVEGNSSSEVIFEFSDGPGSYIYGCDDESFSGFFWVTP